MQRDLRLTESLDGLLDHDAREEVTFGSDSGRSSDDEAQTDERDAQQGLFTAYAKGHHGRGRRSRPSGAADAYEKPTERRLWQSISQRLGRRVAEWRKWILISVMLLGGLGLIAAGGGIWIYKTAPPSGLSQPWYPTRE